MQHLWWPACIKQEYTLKIDQREGDKAETGHGEEAMRLKAKQEQNKRIGGMRMSKERHLFLRCDV